MWFGAGIYFNCTVKKSNFTGIYTKNDGYFGPGICFDLNIDECIFDANFTYNLGGDAGGAICCRATASNCTFNGNYVGNIAFDGAALYIKHLKDSIIDANFTENFLMILVVVWILMI